MSTEPATAEQTTDIALPQTLPQRALTLLETAVKKKADLVALVKGTEDIKAITNAAGRQQVHSALMMLADTRIAFEKTAKAARDKGRVWIDELRAQELGLLGIISPEEKRLRELRDEWDNRIAAEKQALIDKENARKAAHISKIDGMRAALVDYAGKSAQVIESGIRELVAMDISLATFDEFVAPANEARIAVLERLREMHTERLAFEAAQEQLWLDAIAAAEQKARQDAEAAVAAKREAEKVAAERAELAKLRAENERLAKIEQDRQAEAARREREQLDRERQQQEAAAKIERDRIAAEAEVVRKAHEQREAEAKKVRDVEEARIAAERKKLADEQQAALLAAQRERTAAQEAEREIIIGLVADKFQISPELALAKLRELFG